MLRSSEPRGIIAALPASVAPESLNSSLRMTTHGTLKNPRKRTRPPRTGGTVQRVARKPRQESRDRDRAFEPRQRHPGALMRAGAEGEMPVRRAADVEIFRIGELRGIAVGGADAQRHRRTRCQRDAAEFDWLRRHAVAELVRTFKPQDFLDRGLDQIGIFDQPLLLRGVARQRHQPVADQIGGGLMAGVEQEDAVVQQFLCGQSLAIVFALNEAGQHVAFGIAGFGPPALDQDFQIG